MLISTKELTRYDVEALDGSMGLARDFLFDDEHWVVRYLVIDTGKWLTEQKVLVSPMSLGIPDTDARKLKVNLNKDQIESAPPLEAQKPVSRQHEEALHSHYGFPYYWAGTGVWGMTATPGELRRESAAATALTVEETGGERHLRSVQEVTGYHIRATDDEVGHVETFILDDESFALRYMVVDTRNWLPGRKVLIPPAWVEEFDWAENQARVNLTRKEIEESPEWDSSVPLERLYEERLFDYYSRPSYWV